jgi:RimJ/RimL family protein N-acetyltransferase
MIYLRKLTIDDFDYLNYVENNESFWKYSFQKQHYSKDELIKFIYDSQLLLEQTNQIRFVICKTETNEQIGFIDLFEIDFSKSQAGISILISNTQNRSRGYGKLSLKKIIKYAREELNIKNLFCNISKDNISSINFFKSFGFNEIPKNSNLFLSKTYNNHESIIQLQCI